MAIQEQNLKKRQVKNNDKEIKKQNVDEKEKPTNNVDVLTKLKQSFLGFLRQFTKPKVYAVGTISGACTLSVMYISAKYTPFGDSKNYKDLIKLIDASPIASLVISFFPPVLEEFICRKLIFGYLKKYSKFLAYVVSSAVFTLGHYQFSPVKCYEELNTTPTYFIAGLIFAYTYNYTGYLLSSMFAHYLTNGGISVLRTFGFWLNDRKLY